MKKLTNIFTLAVVTILLFISINSCDQKPAEEEKTEILASTTVEELGQMNRDFAKALTAHDAAAAAIVYDENASILPPNEPMVTGRANIKEYWQGAINAGMIDAVVKTVDAKSEGDIGYEIGTFTLRFKGLHGDTIVEQGKYTELLKRNAEGKWISIYGMWNSNDPAVTE